MSLQKPSLREHGYGTHVLLLLCGAVLGTLAGEFFRVPEAHGQIPDSGLQRLQVRQDVLETNRLLNEMLKVLRNETLKVEVVDSDKTRGARTPKRIRR